MKTATLVQATADILTIVTLKTGDVYKRLVTNSYGEKYALRFGVVRDVMHNGEDAVITALEFEPSYQKVEPKLMTFGTDSDLSLFVAEPEEVWAHFQEIIEQAERAVESAATTLSTAESTRDQIRAVVSAESVRALTAASTSPAVS